MPPQAPPTCRCPPPPDVSIRPLRRADAAAYRAVRLEALRLHPEAFGSSPEDEERLTEEDWARRIPEAPPDAVFGAFLAATGSGGSQPLLVGMVAFQARRKAKERHKGGLSGLYVRPGHRGRGIAAALLGRALEHARHEAGVEVVQLAVVTGNATARALYLAAGFVPYGRERHALRLGPGNYRDEELFALDLSALPASPQQVQASDG